MNTFLLIFSDVFSFISLMILFLMLLETRCSRKVTSWIIAGFILAASIVYAIILFFNNGIPIGGISALVFTVPSLIVYLIIAKNRDMRFVFTYCSVDVIGFIGNIISRAIAIPFDDNPVIILVFNIIYFIGMFYLILKIRNRYMSLLKLPNKGWKYFALVSVFFYIMLYLLVSYPVPMVERREYIPVVLVFCLTIVLVYVVIFQTMVNIITIREKEQDQQLLSAQLALQESKLQLQDLYYKMAYLDFLTGLKNRRSFEKEISNITSQNVCCISLDLNNLKQINDAVGHNEGDRLLKRTSQLLTNEFNEHCEVYRVGGDEFIILAVDYPKPQLENKIGIFRSIIKKFNEEGKQSGWPFVDIAFGWDWLLPGEEIQELIYRCDQKMYEDKQKCKSVR